MSDFRHRHQVRDHAFGILNALFGVGIHRIEILDDQGKTIGVGKGPTEAAAREQAWRDVNRKNASRAAGTAQLGELPIKI